MSMLKSSMHSSVRGASRAGPVPARSLASSCSRRVFTACFFASVLLRYSMCLHKHEQAFMRCPACEYPPHHLTTCRPISRSLTTRVSAVASDKVLKTVNVELGDRSYPIYIGNGLLQEKGELLRKHIPGKRVLVVTNETIAPLYLEQWVQGGRRRQGGLPGSVSLPLTHV